jgi:hypothetical protein
MKTFSFQLENDYKVILSGVKGDGQAKRLSSQFIARFFSNFPQLANESQVMERNTLFPIFPPP